MENNFNELNSKEIINNLINLNKEIRQDIKLSVAVYKKSTNINQKIVKEEINKLINK